MALILNKEEQGIVVFWVLKSIRYRTRMIAAGAFIVAGVAIQFVAGCIQDDVLPILVGVFPILLGNLLLVVRGYDNRVNLGKFDPEAKWQQVDAAMLDNICALDAKIKSWDRSTLDVSNCLGCGVGLLFIAFLAFLSFISALAEMPSLFILAVDAAILVLPHFITGTRSILTQPALTQKINVVNQVLAQARPTLERHSIEFFVLSTHAGVKVPDDVKFRVKLARQKPEFLGLYGQVVLNSVQGTKYPYFYAVMVAKNNSGLGDAYARNRSSCTSLLEYKQESGGVEVLVVRQPTTKTSGYHTKPGVAAHIFMEALIIAEAVGQEGGK